MEDEAIAFQYEKMPEDVEKTLNEMNMKCGDLQLKQEKKLL